MGLFAAEVPYRQKSYSPDSEQYPPPDALTDKYAVFPIGAVDKASDPSVKRPTDDHTRTGFNHATEMDQLRHSLNTYAEVAWPHPYLQRVHTHLPE